jgi:hypothetical protein
VPEKARFSRLVDGTGDWRPAVAPRDGHRTTWGSWRRAADRANERSQAVELAVHGAPLSLVEALRRCGRNEDQW